jgi:hypothetical protein
MGNRISELMSIPRPKTTLAISREFELKICQCHGK